jgi:hypothetical protein
LNNNKIEIKDENSKLNPHFISATEIAENVKHSRPKKTSDAPNMVMENGFSLVHTLNMGVQDIN